MASPIGSHLPCIPPGPRGCSTQASYTSQPTPRSTTTATVAATVLGTSLPPPPLIARPQAAEPNRGVPHPQPKPRPPFRRSLVIVGSVRGSDRGSVIIEYSLPSRLAPLTPPCSSLAEQASQSGATLASTLSPDSYLTAPSPSLEAPALPFPSGFDGGGSSVREDGTRIEEI